jgi:hypothetical protein
MFCWKKIKRTNKFAIICSGLLILLFSCGKKSKVVPMYNIDSLVLAQVKNLAAERATLHKSAVIGLQKDDSVFTPSDTSAWLNELDIFRQLDVINRPINRDNYIIDDGLFDPSSNLTVKAFSAVENLPVRYLRIFYQESIHKPRKIEALYDDQNALYKSGRSLLMEFNQVNNKTVLTAYTISGGQKMIMGDSVTFLIKGNIVVD